MSFITKAVNGAVQKIVKSWGFFVDSEIVGPYVSLRIFGLDINAGYEMGIGEDVHVARRICITVDVIGSDSGTRVISWDENLAYLNSPIQRFAYRHVCPVLVAYMTKKFERSYPKAALAV